MIKYCLYPLLILLSAPAFGHSQQGSTTLQLWYFDPLTVTLLITTLILYVRGYFVLREKRRAQPAGFVRRTVYFLTGWLVLVIALCSPVDVLGEYLFSVHMVQHELLMLLAAPLIILSRPTSALLLGTPASGRLLLGKIIRQKSVTRYSGVLLSPLGAWLLHAAGLWAWHIPWLFNASLRSDAIHTLQHFSFVLIALVFWYAMMRNYQQRLGAVLYLFTTAIHASLLGALLTLSPVIWYTPYLKTTHKFGLTPLEDQFLGGIIMWMPAGIAFIAAGLYLTAKYLHTTDTETGTSH